MSRRDETLASVLARHAEAGAERPFVAFESLGGAVRSLSYGDVERRAALAAGCLRRLGVERGATVHVHLVNCPEFYDVWFGAAKLGAAVVPTNPLSTADELAYVLRHAGCGVSVTEPDVIDTVRRAAPHRTVLLARTRVREEGTLLFEEELDRSRPVAGAGLAASRDTAAILYTSGTTSRPKGVMVSHAGYLHAGEVVAQHLRLRPDDRCLIVLPLFHGNAQYYSTLSALVTGASIALVERFSASRWSAQAARLEATVASLFATPIRMILAQPEQPHDRGHRLRVALFAQSLSGEQLAEFERRFGVPLLQLYGMTETVAPPTMNPLDGERRNETIGRPLPWARIRVVDEGGQDVAVGEVGELLIAGKPGETIMSGYLNAPDATAEALRDGWLHTGDNVRPDEDGFLHFVDRSKDMIKRAGENVSASEVERVINEHPAVFESACVGVPDELRDEAIKVFVVLRPGAALTENELIAWCETRLSRFKLPSFVEFVAELPRTSVGKIEKYRLREHR